MKLCVEWENTNTSWLIDIHYVKISTHSYIATHVKCEVKTYWDMEMGYLWIGCLWLKWVGQLWQSELLLFERYALVFRGVPFAVIA